MRMFGFKYHFTSGFIITSESISSELSSTSASTNDSSAHHRILNLKKETWLKIMPRKIQTCKSIKLTLT